jgi:hypothetical protein
MGTCVGPPDQSNGFCDYVDPADNAAGRGWPNADGTPGYTGADGNTCTMEPDETLGHEMIHAVHQGQGATSWARGAERLRQQ